MNDDGDVEMMDVDMDDIHESEQDDAPPVNVQGHVRVPTASAESPQPTVTATLTISSTDKPTKRQRRDNKDPTQTATLLPLLVLDTNFLISHLDILDQLRELGAEDSPYKHKIIVPYWVIQELDTLKSPRSGKKGVAGAARTATNWIQFHLAAHDHCLIGQQLTQVEQVNLRGDDSILDCCLFFQRQFNALTIILTNDKNLCVKALVHGIRTVSYSEKLTAKEIALIVQQEASGIARAPETDTEKELDADMNEEIDASQSVSEKAKTLERVFVTNIGAEISRIMHAAYDAEELDYFGFKQENLQTTRDISKLLQQFSVGLFSDRIPRGIIEKLRFKHAITDEEDLAEFINLWGSVWMHVAKKSDLPQIKHKLARWTSLRPS